MVMRYFYRDSAWWHIGFSYDPELVKEVKSFANSGFNPELREWYVPVHITTSAAVQKWLADHNFREGRVYTPSRRVVEYQEPPEVITTDDVLAACKEISLKRTPRHYQAEGIAYMINHGNCINGDDCGLGKAQPLNTKIRTMNGYILMKDIRVGDKILHPTGGEQIVEKIYPQGVKSMYKVTFSDGSFTHCCNEHLWNVATDNWIKRGKPYQTLSLDQIMAEDIFACKNKKAYRYRIPITNVIQYSPVEVEIQPYLLGCLIGDGGLTKSVRFTTIDDEILDHFELPEGCYIHKESKDKITYSITGIRGPISAGNQAIFRKLLRKYGLFGTRSDTKFIPKDYLYNSEEVRLEILRGLLDTDGTVNSGGDIGFSTTSEQLMKDLQELVWSLGGTIRIGTRIGRYKKNGVLKYCKKSYRCSIMLPKGVIPFKLKRKVDRFNQPRKYSPVRKIVAIEYVGEAEMQCIKVSQPDGLYLCDDFIVTHNTGQSIVTVELMDVFPTLVICPASVKYNWKKEWQKWNPTRTVGIVESGRNYDESVWDSDVVVINFDILGERSTDKPKAKYKELLRKYWGSCVIDEIHFLKSEKAMRTRMTKKITKPIAHIWGLTGTLTQNRPLELVQPYQILRRFVEIFGGTLEFKFRYCDAKKTMYGFDASGFSNLEELHELLRMAGYVRRQKRDVLTELPPVIEQIVDAPISNAREYHHAEDDLLNYLETIDVEKASSAANAPHLVMLNTLRTLSIAGKMAFIKSYIQEWLESNEEKQLAVFGVHREPLQELADHFKAPVIQGGVSIENKQRIVDAFAARKHRLLFANIQSAGTGTDGLQTHCSDMIYIELPDRSTDVEQTNARLERMGQTSTITVTYLLSPETIDVEMKETLDGKKMLTDIVNAGHSENELIAMKFFRNRRRNS